jgi:hypothetical protein
VRGRVGEQRARDAAMTVWVTCPEETCDYLHVFLQARAREREREKRREEGDAGWSEGSRGASPVKASTPRPDKREAARDCGLAAQSGPASTEDVMRRLGRGTEGGWVSWVGG